jgi:hypothetical protein
MSNQRFEILSLLVQNVLTSNSKHFQLHGDKQVIVQVLPTAPDRAFITNDCYDSSYDLGSITYTDILQRLLRTTTNIRTGYIRSSIYTRSNTYCWLINIIFDLNLSF